MQLKFYSKEISCSQQKVNHPKISILLWVRNFVCFKGKKWLLSLYSLPWRWQTWPIFPLSSWFYPFICISMSPILWPFLKRTFITYTLLSGQISLATSQRGNWGSRCYFIFWIVWVCYARLAAFLTVQLMSVFYIVNWVCSMCQISNS